MGPMNDGPNQFQTGLQSIAQQAQANMQPVPPVGADQGNSVKRFLTNFFYGVGQGALHSVGLPTDYEKQQQVIQNNDRQQQLAGQAQEIQSLTALHQQQLADGQRKQQQDAYNSEEIPVGDSFGKLFGIDPSTRMARGAIQDAFYKHLTTPPHERTPLLLPIAG